MPWKDACRSRACGAWCPYAAEASGFFARVIQHECDHLDGKVYLDRMDDMRTLSFLRERHRHGPDVEDPEH